MNGVMKGIIIGIVIMYLISPVDIVPGMPIDDLIALVLGVVSLASNKRGNRDDAQNVWRNTA